MKHYECVHDFNGTRYDPPCCADVFIDEDDSRMILTLAGNWKHYDPRLTDEVVESTYEIDDIESAFAAFDAPAAETADFVLSLRRREEQ